MVKFERKLIEINNEWSKMTFKHLSSLIKTHQKILSAWKYLKYLLCDFSKYF